MNAQLSTSNFLGAGERQNDQSRETASLKLRRPRQQQPPWRGRFRHRFSRYGKTRGRKNMLSAKRTHRFGRRRFVYHQYSKILMSFAGGFAGGFVSGKRTQIGGSVRSFSLKSGFVSEERSHWGSRDGNVSPTLKRAGGGNGFNVHHWCGWVRRRQPRRG